MKISNNVLINKLVEILRVRSTSEIISSEHEIYDEVRLVYNRMHDCYPALIVRTLNIEDLRLVMQFAFKNKIVLAIRGGGHHIGGFGTCDGGIVIDFSPFKKIAIDESKNLAHVSPGVCLGDVDRVLSRQGYIIPTGTVSQTGIAGLTLGGGIGWLVGKFGLTCDQLCGADVLLADGRHVKAENPEHEDLLWALKGGGGNFGIVTEFRYKLNRLPKTICGMGFVNWGDSVKVMCSLLNYLKNSPPSISVAFVFARDNQNKPCLKIDFCCADVTDVELEALLSFSDRVEWSNVRCWDFDKWQSEFDSCFLPPMRGYWKAAYLEEISPSMIESLFNSYESHSLKNCTIMFEHLHGSFKKFDHTSSAFPLRYANFGIVFSARWEEKNFDKDHIDWVKNSFSLVDPRGLSGTYSNYTTNDDHRAVESLISIQSARIIKVKNHYDPNNYFNRNHNVRPKQAELTQ